MEFLLENVSTRSLYALRKSCDTSCGENYYLHNNWLLQPKLRSTGYFRRTQVGSGIQQKYPVTGYSTARKGIPVAKLARDVAITFSSATLYQVESIQ